MSSVKMDFVDGAFLEKFANMFQKIPETSLTGLTTSFSGNRIAGLEFIHISLQCFVKCY